MSRKLPQFCLSAIALLAALWLTVRYFFPIALPFLFGFLLAVSAEPAVRLLHQKCRLPRPVACGFSVSLVFILGLGLLALVLGLLMRQMTRLQHVLPQLEAAATQGISLLRQWLRQWTQYLPESLRGLTARFEDPTLSGSTLAQQALQKLLHWITQLVGSLSSGLFGLITGIISGYMISGRLPQLRQKLQDFLPESWKNRYFPALQRIRRALGGWLLAQCKLAGVAFFLLLAGFLLLRIPNGPLLAALVTFVDAFPVLGVGTVLLPWSLICLLQQNIPRCLGLLGLYLVIWLTRSILEPRLVGKSLGLDPLLTLIALYAGWRLLGITGMLFSPILAMAAVQTWQTWKQGTN